jgi:UDP-N-acetylmuramoyl-tripeptide--D-alanyl-D-alanine ligase
LSGLKGQKILVMGDMKELGEDTDSVHSSVGQYASAANIGEVWATGEKSKLAIEACAAKGRYFEDKEALIAALIDISNPDLTILIKGSRGARMNEVVAALRIDGETEC